MLNANLDDVSLYLLSVLRFGFKKRIFLGGGGSTFSMLDREYGIGFLLFRINLDLPIRNPLDAILQLLNIMYFFDKNVYFW